MKYEAIDNFSGVISMVKGEVREIPNKSLAQDLMNAKLIKKYVASDSEALKEELEISNKKIEELENQNKLLLAENEELKLLLDETVKSQDTRELNGDEENSDEDLVSDGEDEFIKDQDLEENSENKAKNKSQKK